MGAPSSAIHGNPRTTVSSPRSLPVYAITGRMRCGFEWARLPARPTETLTLPWARLAHFRFTRSQVGCGVVLKGAPSSATHENPRTTVGSPRSLPVTRSQVGCGVGLNGRAFQRDPRKPSHYRGRARLQPRQLRQKITGFSRCGKGPQMQGAHARGAFVSSPLAQDDWGIR